MSRQPREREKRKKERESFFSLLGDFAMIERLRERRKGGMMISMSNFFHVQIANEEREIAGKLATGGVSQSRAAGTARIPRSLLASAGPVSTRAALKPSDLAATGPLYYSAYLRVRR